MLPAQPSRELTGGAGVANAPVAGRRLGIVAGGGALPEIVARAAEAAGWKPVIATIADGRTAPWARERATPFGWNRTGDLFGHLRRHGVEDVVFCGTISVRPDYRTFLPSLHTLLLLPEIFRITRGGDDSLLRAVGRAFERRGFRLRAVQEIVPELLAPAGSLAGPEPSEEDRRALHRAAESARWLGLSDIGQAAVASAERVIALEGIEGTREMLARVADLRRRGRISPRERCVLMKGVKPQQDRRFDLPSIGPETVREAREAGLVGIGVSAGASLMIGLDEIMVEAHAGGLFIVGVEEEAA